jgi:hypothetical protein
MTRSKLSSKVILLATSIGLSTAAFAGSAVAQSYPDTYSCPAGQVYDPTYGCTWPYDYDYGGYGLYYGGHRDFGHGFGHGMGGDFKSFAHAGGGFGGFHGGGGFGGGGHR